MLGQKLRAVVATAAPTIATALGGPLAGVATRALAEKLLGRPDASLEEVEAAVSGLSGSDLTKLKIAEKEFAAQMKEADIKLERVAADDRASARDRQVALRDRTPAILGLAIIVGFFGVLGYVFRYGMPDHGTEVLLIMMGALGTMTSQVGNFFFGSSSGSKSKDAIISELKGATR